jgi:predicted phage terminase large subunit-like protein
MKQQDKKAKDQYLKKLAIARQAGSANAYETKEEQIARIERAKKDPQFMINYYFPQYADCESADFQIKWLKRVKRDPMLIAFCKWGVGLAKSVLNNIFVPFMLWLCDEPVYLVVVGQNEKRAQQLLDDIRAEFEANPKIIHDFGEQKQLGTWEDGFFQTRGGFIGQAIGFRQSTRGLRVKNLRPTLFNLDDLETKQTVRNERIQDEGVEWIEGELLGRMDGNYERMILSNNWFAPSMIMRKLAERHPDWHVDEVIAYNTSTYEPAWPSKYTPEYYKKKEKKMGISTAHAEYCHIAKIEGKIFKPELVQWTKLPPLNHFKTIVAHWDIAYAGNPTSDYNAVRIWGLYKNNFYLIDCFVKQTKMKPAVRWIAHKHKTTPDTVVIHWRAESQFWNDEVKRTIKEVEEEEGVQLPITMVDTPKTKKIDRIIAGLEALYQNGRVFYNEDLKSHNDTQKGLQQLYGIEPGNNNHDDAPDADQQAISHLSKFIIIGKKTRKPKVGRVESKNIA